MQAFLLPAAAEGYAHGTAYDFTGMVSIYWVWEKLSNSLTTVVMVVLL
jgi:hypothetical protein